MAVNLPFGRGSSFLRRSTVFNSNSSQKFVQFSFTQVSLSQSKNRGYKNPKTAVCFANLGHGTMSHRFRPQYSADSNFSQSSDKPKEKEESTKIFLEWDSLTSKFAGAANIPFLLLQLPQIILNSHNLLAGNKAALFAVPWLGMLTGLLGNLALLSYFAKKKETEAVLVQTLGVISTYVVIIQLAMAEAMPFKHFTITSIVVASGLVLNFLNYFGWLSEGIWQFWEDFITIGGISVLPQVMWSTFIPFLPNSILPGSVALMIAIVTVVMARTSKFSKGPVKAAGSISGWTATLLFMWMPIAQMWTNYLNPDNIRGLSAFTMLLAMIGNGLMIPRALFIRDLMWLTGSVWSSFLQGWGNLLWMFFAHSISWEFFTAATLGLFTWIGIVLWRDSRAHGHDSPLMSLKELLRGT